MRLVHAAMEKALDPWRRRKEIEKIIAEAPNVLPLFARSILEPTKWEVQARRASVNTAPVHKDHITDWITVQTSQGLAFKTVELKPAAIQVNGNWGVTCYWITYKWLDKDGNGATHTLRITHTLLRDGKDWHIISGMSMPEGANPQK